ncbi:RNA polymerase sigma factor [Actinokineospora cianjurensis]|uniref:Sigma-70-like protein n=1 Tax=Actinokineospora cianjurensis TaxID=585224 RepID=A0A421B326_9PSEU|nr:sigma factor [Actinokineospora cianjurensis]RLK58735.1 sigma-70-like protein [Actinokineospora cianjurensis]
MTTELELIRSARAGCARAFGELVLPHHAAACLLAEAMGAGEDTEDVVRAAVLHALRRAHTLRAGARFRPWLLAIVADLTRTLHRRHQRAAAAGGSASSVERVAT